MKLTRRGIVHKFQVFFVTMLVTLMHLTGQHFPKASVSWHLAAGSCAETHADKITATCAYNVCENRMAGEPFCIMGGWQYERSLLNLNADSDVCRSHQFMHRVERVLACCMILLTQCLDSTFCVHLVKSPYPFTHRHVGIPSSVRYKSHVT